MIGFWGEGWGEGRWVGESLAVITDKHRMYKTCCERTPTINRVTELVLVARKDVKKSKMITKMRMSSLQKDSNIQSWCP